MARKIPRIAIFASGSGSNAEKIILQGLRNKQYSTEWIICNRRKAGVIVRAKKYDIPVVHLQRDDFYQSQSLIDTLDGIDLIVLAGFLWLIPDYLIEAYPNKILNIHPALLPAYGGKGMYGMNVHKAVFNAKEKYSGISIHYVNKKYDEGELLFQATCSIQGVKSPEEIADRVLKLEHQYYPITVENELVKLR